VEFKEFNLKELVKQYPLDDSVPDGVVSKKALASAFNTSTNTIDKWVQHGMPVENEGGNGQSYEFQLSHCWAWYHARNAEQKERQDQESAAVRAMQLALTGGQLGEGIDSLSPKEKREVIETQMAYEQFELARGSMIPKEEFLALLDGVFVPIRDGITTLPDRLERECDLDGNTVERAVIICDETLSEAQQRIREFLSENNKKGKPVRTNLFDA
jgi:hypothetical protein